MQKSYVPQPLDTSDVQLPAELEELTERMARNVHEVWAKNRMDQGWSYGAQRDDVKLHHPCLVAYDELTDVERQYDRDTSLETIKLILKLGFTIEKK